MPDAGGHGGQGGGREGNGGLSRSHVSQRANGPFGLVERAVRADRDDRGVPGCSTRFSASTLLDVARFGRPEDT
jgi:hypothetical protein